MNWIYFKEFSLATKVNPTTRCFKEIKKPLHTSKKSKELAQSRETQVTCEKITHFLCVRAEAASLIDAKRESGYLEGKQEVHGGSVEGAAPAGPRLRCPFC